MTNVLEVIEGLPANVSEIVLPIGSISFKQNSNEIHPFFIEVLDTPERFKEKVKNLLLDAVLKHGGALLVSRGLTTLNGFLNSYIAVYGFNENTLYDSVTPVFELNKEIIENYSKDYPNINVYDV